MIYLDNAATTFQKPPAVQRTLCEAMRRYGANAGRGGHKLSIAASEMVYKAGEAVAELFGIQDPANIAFTLNTTMALNMAIKGVLLKGGHVIITSMEHNSVARPVVRVAKNRYTVVRANRQGIVNPADVEAAIQDDTRLIVCNHASNVCGSIQDISEIGRIASGHGILFLVDVAQSGGVLPINVEKQHIDLLAFAGHKSLMGPQGTGGLYVREGLELDTILEGGTGSQSESLSQPINMPDRLMSGTVNMPAIAALGEGIRFVRKLGVGAIAAHEMKLAGRLMEGFGNIEGVTVYGPESVKNRVGVVSINIDGLDSITVSQILDQDFGICVRSGLHCAPLAHETIGTLENGTVRFSVGYYNTQSDVDRALTAVSKIKKGKYV